MIEFNNDVTSTKPCHGDLRCVTALALLPASPTLRLKHEARVAGAGGKDQQERTETIQRFKDGRADVLCATDIAAKGLDFDGASCRVLHANIHAVPPPDPRPLRGMRRGVCPQNCAAYAAAATIASCAAMNEHNRGQNMGLQRSNGRDVAHSLAHMLAGMAPYTWRTCSSQPRPCLLTLGRPCMPSMLGSPCTLHRAHAVPRQHRTRPPREHRNRPGTSPTLTPLSLLLLA